METADIVVIGAGVIGLSVAHELGRLGAGTLAILEKERLAGSGSTAACTGGIRLQFSSEANIRFSLAGLARYRSFAEEMGVDIGLASHGYLFLVTDPARMPRYAEGHALQRSLGVDSGFVDPDWIAKRAPFLSLEGVVAGSYCAAEAHADPHSVVQGYMKALAASGVRVQTGREVTAVRTQGGRVTGVETSGGPLSAPIVIDCAGPFAGAVAATAGVELPLVARKRHVAVALPGVAIAPELPLTVDDGSGWYVKAEPGGVVLMGGTDRDGSPSLDTLAEEHIVDAIIEAGIRRAPGFEEARLVRTIVGLRCMSPDDHALIGAVPEVEGLYCAAGFSGHGFMHAPPAGEALASMVVGGVRPPDLAAFDPGRFRSGVERPPESYVF
jgi:sarcosine oxidase subunit beta